MTLGLALVVCWSPSSAVQAQEAAVVLEDTDGDTLRSGGGDIGTQFPDGIENCGGDRHHRAHDYPTNPCVLRNNPHFATTLGGGTHCTARAKHCDSCYECCGLQKDEADSCHCFEDTCEAMLEDIHRTCRHDCFGNFLEGCGVMP